MTASAPVAERIVEPPVVVARGKHTLTTRWMHWLNFPLLAIMLWTGLRIYNANAVHAIDILGFRFEFFPDGFFEFFEARRRLAKGIGYHLTFGWLFAVNGVAYGAYLAISGRWRELAPDRYTARELPKVVAHDLHLRSDAPPHGKYNAAQRVAYSAVIGMGALMLLSGFAIYKPVQLRPLVVILGGYEVARLIHFTVSLALVAFFGVHILQVVRAGWRNFASIITGFELQPAVAAASTAVAVGPVAAAPDTNADPRTTPDALAEPDDELDPGPIADGDDPSGDDPAVVADTPAVGDGDDPAVVADALAPTVGDGDDPSGGDPAIDTDATAESDTGSTAGEGDHDDATAEAELDAAAAVVADDDDVAAGDGDDVADEVAAGDDDEDDDDAGAGHDGATGQDAGEDDR